MPPTGIASIAGKSYCKAMFKSSMINLTAFRKHFYQSGYVASRLETKLHTLAEHFDNARAVLKWSPHTWVRKLLGLSKALDTPYHKPGCYIYALFSLCNGYMYVGKTERTLMVRYRGHIRCALQYKGLIDRQEFIDPDDDPLYATMAHLGPENSMILPLDTCPPPRVLTVERTWIARMGKKVYNTTGNLHKRRKKGHMRSVKLKLLKRAHA